MATAMIHISIDNEPEQTRIPQTVNILSPSVLHRSRRSEPQVVKSVKSQYLIHSSGHNACTVRELATAILALSW